MAGINLQWLCGSRGKPQSLVRWCASVCLRQCVFLCPCRGVCSGTSGDISCCTFTVRGWEALSSRGLRRLGQEGQVRGSAVGVCRTGWLKLNVAGRLVSSRAGCTFLSPPTGYSSSAPGSGRDPLGRRPLSTLPGFGKRQRHFWNSRGSLLPQSILYPLSFPYKARKSDQRPEVNNYVLQLQLFVCVLVPLFNKVMYFPAVAITPIKDYIIDSP